MKRGQFIIGETTSDELLSFIQTRPVIRTPVRKIDRIPIVGKSGDLIIDEDAYENGDMTLSLFCKGNAPQHKEQLKSLITKTFDTGIYQSFVPYWDSDYIYEVISISGVEFQDNLRFGNSLPYSVELSYKPFKKLRHNSKITNTSAFSIMNPMYYPSDPYIKITGDGDITLDINGRKTELNNVDGFIELDSEIEECFKQTDVLLNRNDRMVTINFPTLDVGLNEISWTGSVTKVEMDSRWRTL